MSRGSRSVQLYCYLGGGGLTEASTFLAQGVVVKAKTRKLAIAVCVAVRVLTEAVPGPTAGLEETFCTLDEELPDDDIEQPDASTPEGLAEFLTQYDRALGFVCGRFQWNPSQFSLDHSPLSDARNALQTLRRAWYPNPYTT